MAEDQFSLTVTLGGSARLISDACLGLMHW